MEFAPLAEHSPRPAGDPDYVPWWAKGEYAKKNGTKYSTESGVIIESGWATGRVPMHLRRDPVPAPLPTPASATQAPRKVSATPAKRFHELDTTARLLATYRTREARLALCGQYGVDPKIYTTAPNPGVAAMRLANALRRQLREAPEGV
jgi:hypothetical protein